jgi:hypothetical protein
VEDLPEPPPNRVARHRVSHLPGDGEPQAGRPELVGESVHGEQPALASGALTVNPLKLWEVGQACALTPRQRSDGQPFAPAPAPGGDDPASADRAHALAKTVRLGSLAAIRLVRALHETPLRAIRVLKAT